MKALIIRSYVILISLLFAGSLVRASSQVRCAKLPDNSHAENFPQNFRESFSQAIDYQTIHQELAGIERDARALFRTHKTQNLVVASISVVVHNSAGQLENRTFPVNYIFESRIDYSKNHSNVFNAVDNLENFSHLFELDVASFPNLIQHLKNCIGDKKNREVELIEDEIRSLYAQEQKFSQSVHSTHFKLSHSLTELAPSADHAEKRIEAHRKGIFFPPYHHQRDGLQSELDHRKYVIGKLKADFAFGIQQIEDFQQNMRDLLTKFYSKFWHSEQRLLYHLMNDDADIDSNENSIQNTMNTFLVDNLGADEKIAGIVIHLHSHYSPCAVCYFLIQSAIPKLRTKFEQNSVSVAVSYNVPYDQSDDWIKYFAGDSEH